MAKPKGTGTSSYERICAGLAATSEFLEYERAFARKITSARVDGFTFEKLAASCRGDGKPDHAFEVTCGEARVPEFRFNEPGSLKLSIDCLVTADSLAPVMATFGTKVRTFFCKEDGVRERFLSHCRAILLERYASAIAEAETRIAQQARNLESSGHLEESRQVAYENEAVDEIRSVMLKFRNIRKEALKRAIDEFIVHSISED